MLLYEGKWEANDGRIFTIPAFTDGKEDGLVETAQCQAYERGLEVVCVWAVYISESQIYHRSPPRKDGK